jgi:hypothetical protein
MYVQSSINSMVLECFIGTSMDKEFFLFSQRLKDKWYGFN